MAYIWTLQTDVNGGSHDYQLDTGEIQVALNLWGTIHYTGYPHYTILSTLLTRLIVALGISPASAVSATSMIWMLLAFWFFYQTLVRLLHGGKILAGLAILCIGVMETFWLHSTLGEVYSFSLLLVSLALFLGLRLHTQWHSREWLLLLLVLGTAAAHHRILLILTPMVILLIWSSGWHWLWQKRIHSFCAIALFLVPFIAYLYLPLRAWQNALWVYGRPGNWVGFWEQFTGSEVTGGLLNLPTDATSLWDNWHFLSGHMITQAPWAFWLLGLIGLLWLSYQDGRLGGALLLGTAVLLTFVFLFPRAVWAPAVLMSPLLFLMVGVAYLWNKLGQFHPTLAVVGGAGLLFLAGYLFYANLPFVQQLTHNPSGRAMISLLQKLADEEALRETKPTVALPWGNDYFAAAYGLYVTDELPAMVLVDHRADFTAIMAEEGRILTPASYLHYWPPAWWEGVVGEGVVYEAVTAEIVAIQRPFSTPLVPLDIDFDLGNGVRIRSAHITQGADDVVLTIYWEVVHPLERDYSVAVHLLEQFPAQGADDIVAQADAGHPVQGWYPTSRWTEGEVVVDRYRLEGEEGTATAVAVTMYYVNEAGEFVNMPWFALRLPD